MFKRFFNTHACCQLTFIFLAKKLSTFAYTLFLSYPEVFLDKVFASEQRQVSEMYFLEWSGVARSQ